MKIILATTLALGLGVSAAAADQPTNLLDLLKSRFDTQKTDTDNKGDSYNAVSDGIFGGALDKRGPRDTSGNGNTGFGSVSEGLNSTLR